MNASLKQRLKSVARPVIRRLSPPPVLPSAPAEPDPAAKTVSRHFIDQFLQANRDAVSGRVLELSSCPLIDSSGGESATVVDHFEFPQDEDSSDAEFWKDLPSAHYDCAIVVETLEGIFDLRTAAREIARILKPGGTLLATATTTGALGPRENRPVYWRLTPVSLGRLFEEVFGKDSVTTDAFGNYRTCLASLAGIPVEEIETEALAESSPLFVQGVTLRALKPS